MELISAKFSHQPLDVIQFVRGKTRIPGQTDLRLDPYLAFVPFTPDMHMPFLAEIEAEEAHPVRAVGDGNSGHR